MRTSLGREADDLSCVEAAQSPQLGQMANPDDYGYQACISGHTPGAFELLAF